MNEKKVSIIMPAYNAAQFIENAIDSVLLQSYQNWELIVVDDCSTDTTKECVEKYCKEDKRIKIFGFEQNVGAAEARNYAIEKAESEYIAFLDSDDVWLENKLEEQIKYMEDRHLLFTSTHYNKIDENGKETGTIVYAKKELDYWGVLKYCPGNSTVILNAHELGKIFAPNIRKRNDYALWLVVIKKSGKLYGIDKVLSSHRVTKDSLSNNKIELVSYQWYVYRKLEKITCVKSFYLIIFMFVKSVFKIDRKIRMKDKWELLL